jgi:hypothetical protein
VRGVRWCAFGFRCDTYTSDEPTCRGDADPLDSLMSGDVLPVAEAAALTQRRLLRGQKWAPSPRRALR